MKMNNLCYNFNEPSITTYSYNNSNYASYNNDSIIDFDENNKTYSSSVQGSRSPRISGCTYFNERCPVDGEEIAVVCDVDDRGIAIHGTYSKGGNPNYYGTVNNQYISIQVKGNDQWSYYD